MTVRRKSPTYSEAHRYGAMMLAIRDGIGPAAKATKTPQSTIYTWLAEAGGLVEIRNFVNAMTERSLSAAEQAVYDEVTRRLRGKQMTDDELMITFRAMYEANAKGGGATAIAAAGAQSSSQAIVVNLIE